MSEAIVAFLAKKIPNVYLLCSLLTALPVTEIKGSLLYAAVSGADLLAAYAVCTLSSAILCILLCLVVPRGLRWVEGFPKIGKIVSFVTDRLGKKAESIEKGKGEVTFRKMRQTDLVATEERLNGKKDNKDRRMLGLFAFVALPLPLTGVWAGALLASLLRLSFKNSVFALVAGNITAGGIVLFIALVAGDHADLVLNMFLIAALGAILATIGKGLVKNLRKRAKV